MARAPQEVGSSKSPAPPTVNPLFPKNHFALKVVLLFGIKKQPNPPAAFFKKLIRLGDVAGEFFELAFPSVLHQLNGEQRPH